MLPLLRPLTAIAFVSTLSLYNQGVSLFQQYALHQLQQTRKCFHCNLSNLKLVAANLEGADLRSSDLQNAELRAANLRYANLAWSDLRGANLQGADLTGANLANALFNNADLQYANLNQTNLKAADFRDANLYQTTLLNAQERPLDRIQEKRAPILCQTILPSGMLTRRDCDRVKLLHQINHFVSAN